MTVTLTLAVGVAIFGSIGKAQAALEPGLLATGTTVVPNSQVIVYLEPEVYGSSVTLPVVATTTSDSAGNWSVYSFNTADMQAAESANSADGAFAVFLVVTQDPSGNVTSDQIERVPSSASGGAFTEVDGSQPAPVSSDSTANAIANTTPIDPNPACTGSSSKQDGVWSTMTEVHAAGDINGSYGYGESGDSHIRWMFSQDGSAGSWGGESYDYISGSSSGSRGTIPFGAATSTHVQGTFTYVRTIYGGTCSYLGHQIHARYWDGGLRFANPISGVDGNCNPSSARTIDLTAGQTRDKNSGTDYKYSSAATAFGVVGFAHYAGFDTNAYTHWKAGTVSQNHYLCGSDDVFTRASKIFAGG